MQKAAGALEVNEDDCGCGSCAICYADAVAERRRDIAMSKGPNITLQDGSPVTEDHRDIVPGTGMQKGYVVLSEEERAKGFVRPVRLAYKHLECGHVTKMDRSIAETYARDPKFYSGTFCSFCRTHKPLDQFVWDGTDIQVGT